MQFAIEICLLCTTRHRLPQRKIIAIAIAIFLQMVKTVRRQIQRVITPAIDTLLYGRVFSLWYGVINQENFPCSLKRIGRV